MITNIALHRIGNKIHQEGVSLSLKEMTLTGDIQELLTDFLLNATTKQEATYQFYQKSALSRNSVYKYVNDIFEEKDGFINVSRNIGMHLYEVVETPRIQGGDLFVVKFQTEEMESVGIFKIERKETFLKFKISENSEVESDTGVSITKIDKAAIIYNTEMGDGYLVKVVDNNKQGDEQYWLEDFLGVRQRQDDFFYTQKSLIAFRDFVKKELPQEYEVTPIDEADLLNKGLIYFKENEIYNADEFAEEVLGDEDLKESFENYLSDYEQAFQISIPEEFGINPTAVKKSQRFFKSVIKLDKNFHIYIHGDKKNVEQGEDKKGRFYKLYYTEEN